MELLDLLLTLVLIVLIVFLIVNLFGRKRIPTVSNVDPYTVALNHMLHGENEAAIRTFKDVIKKDTDNLDAYINLGILLRRTGKTDSAIQIHQGLLYRQNLTKAQRLEILRNLVEDYIGIDEKNMALRYAQEMLALDRKNVLAHERICDIERGLKHWESAYEYLEKVMQLKGIENLRLLAIYKVQEGLEKYNAGQYHEARLVFRKAIRIDPNCESAHYYIAKSYIYDKREVDSVDWFVKFADLAPEKAALVFRPLQTILFNLGSFGNIESFYQNILKRRPGDAATLIALAGFYEKKGNLSRATSILEDLLEKNPHNTLAKIALCKLLVGLNNAERVTAVLNELIEQMETREEFRCSNCNTVSSDVQWLCPNCGLADTFFS